MVRAVGVCGLVAVVAVSSLLTMKPEAQAVPAFARKYNLNCQSCHTRFPRLNTFGERFLENGYQLPGTEDGGITGKKRLGDLTLNDVSQVLAFGLKGNYNSFTGTGSGATTSEIAFPETMSLWLAGTLTRNVGFLVEPEFNLREGHAEMERAFVTFNNLGGQDLVHVRVGRLDPSGFWSYPTLRQQVQTIAAKTSGGGAFVSPTIDRVGLGPSFMAAKFYGLFDNAGQAVDPFHEALYNSHAEMGVDVHGRPFGKWFLYQAGVLNGAGESFGDSNKQKDWYAMGRVDWADSNLFSAGLSGMGYFGNNNAKVGTGQSVDWSRYGVAANVRYRMLDFTGAYTLDRVTRLPAGIIGFDATAAGFTLNLDALVTDRTLLTARYDHLDAGGESAQRKSRSTISFQAKYYVRPHIALSLRNDTNVRKAEGGSGAAGNFRNAIFVGLDLAL
ncbi:MAG: hypothetical protein HZA21_03795 [Nitrospirae bacterium]|nr:hypothetical protein [Nitrospirota bacterium]